MPELSPDGGSGAGHDHSLSAAALDDVHRRVAAGPPPPKPLSPWRSPGAGRGRRNPPMRNWPAPSVTTNIKARTPRWRGSGRPAVSSVSHDPGSPVSATATPSSTATPITGEPPCITTTSPTWAGTTATFNAPCRKAGSAHVVPGLPRAESRRPDDARARFRQSLRRLSPVADRARLSAALSS